MQSLWTLEYQDRMYSPRHVTCRCLSTVFIETMRTNDLAMWLHKHVNTMLLEPFDSCSCSICHIWQFGSVLQLASHPTFLAFTDLLNNSWPRMWHHIGSNLQHVTKKKPSKAMQCGTPFFVLRPLHVTCLHWSNKRAPHQVQTRNAERPAGPRPPSGSCPRQRSATPPSGTRRGKSAPRPEATSPEASCWSCWSWNEARGKEMDSPQKTSKNASESSFWLVVKWERRSCTLFYRIT